MKLNLGTLARLAARAVDVYQRSGPRRAEQRGPAHRGSERRGPRGRTAPSPARPRPTAPSRAGRDLPGGLSRPYPGDWTGPVRPVYRPLSDGEADPGEIVWTWVPFEEDHRRGKDRPVLVVDRAGDHLLCLMLTSRDRSNEREQDPDHMDIGTGPWDPRGRPSEVRLDRVVQVLPADVRREGSVLPEQLFDRVAGRLDHRRG